MEQTRCLFGCGSLSITTPVPLLANKFDARSVFHGQVSLVAVNQAYVVHEAMHGCKKLRIHVIPLFHTGHESPESPRIDFFLIRGDS